MNGRWPWPAAGAGGAWHGPPDPGLRRERPVQGRHRLRHPPARADPARARPLHGRSLARHGRGARHRDLGLDRLPAERAADEPPRLAQGRRRHGARQGGQGDARPLRLRARHLQFAVSRPDASATRTWPPPSPVRSTTGWRPSGWTRTRACWARPCCPSSRSSGRWRRSSGAPATSVSCRC